MSREIRSNISLGIPKKAVPDWISDVKSNLYPRRSAEEIERMKKEKVVFSFHFLDTQDELFNCGRTGDDWFLHLLQNIKQISNLNKQQFISQRQHFDVHPITWGKPNLTREQFNINPQLIDFVDPGDQIQFRLSSSGGRVHGFFVYNTFYVVWLDPHHNLDPDQRFGGAKYYDSPLTPYQELEIEYHRLKKEYEEVLEMLDEQTTPDAS